MLEGEEPLPTTLLMRLLFSFATRKNEDISYFSRQSLK